MSVAHDRFAPVVGGDVPALSDCQRELLVLHAPQVAPHDALRHAHGHAPLGVDQHVDAGGGCRDTFDRLDLADAADAHGSVAEAAHRGGGVGDDDFVAVVADAAVHEEVDLLGHAAHDHEREHPDGDAEDGQKGPELSAEDVPEHVHDPVPPWWSASCLLTVSRSGRRRESGGRGVFACVALAGCEAGHLAS